MRGSGPIQRVVVDASMMRSLACAHVTIEPQLGKFTAEFWITIDFNDSKGWKGNYIIQSETSVEYKTAKWFSSRLCYGRPIYAD